MFRRLIRMPGSEPGSPFHESDQGLFNFLQPCSIINPMTEAPNPRGAAFFDVDYTVLSDNSASLFVRYMRAQGKVGIGTILVTIYYLVLYKLNLLDFERLADRETARYAGQPEAEMIELCDRWFEEMVVDYIYPEAVELIRKHQAEGTPVVLLSAASIYLVRPLGRRLGVEHWLCNRPEVEDGKFTGRLLRPLSYGEGKIELARAFCAEHGLELSESLYYSDSITDLPVLAAFGRPVAVNADPMLRREAKKRGWPLIDFPRRPA